MDGYFILNEEGEVIPTTDLLAWAEWFELSDRVVQQNTFGPVKVSTVFLGIDHSFGYGPPLLFETLVFTKEEGGVWRSVDNSMRRYETKEQVLQGHNEVLTLLKSLHVKGGNDERQ